MTSRVSKPYLVLVVVALGALVVSVLPERANADGSGCFPVFGQFDADSVPPPECMSPVGLCTHGRLTGALRGTYDFVASTFIPSGAPTTPAITFYTGESVITTRRGATITATDTGTVDLDPTRYGGISSLLTVTGTTGHLAGATGQLQLAGHLDFATGRTRGTYHGKLCFEH